MKASNVILAVQSALQIGTDKQAPVVGPLTRSRFAYLQSLKPDDDYLPDGPAHPVGSLPPQAVPGTLAVSRLLSDAGETFIKAFEGLVLVGADDGFGNPTIGWGHTGLQHNDGTVRIGEVITEDQAEAFFKYDMNQFETRVCKLVTVPLNQDQFDALVSFDFNTGGLGGAGSPSTLLRDLNAGKYDDAAEQLLLWNHADGRVVAGLTRRRQSERRLFLGLTPAIVEG